MTETQKQWAAIALAVVVGVTLAGYKLYDVFLPAASEYIAEEIPEAIYQAIGESSLQTLDEEEFKASELTLERQQEVQQHFAVLLQELDFPENKHQLHFRNWHGKMNAFALMDGSVVVTDSLVNNFETPQQLEAVLLHELGHIENNHLMENSIRVSLFYITMSLLFGDVSVVSDLLIESSAMGINLSYSREFEDEADLYASEHLKAAYGNADAMIQALEILHQHNDSDDNSWLSTHPSLAERVANISDAKQ